MPSKNFATVRLFNAHHPQAKSSVKTHPEQHTHQVAYIFCITGKVVPAAPDVTAEQADIL